MKNPKRLTCNKKYNHKFLKSLLLTGLFGSVKGLLAEEKAILDIENLDVLNDKSIKNNHEDFNIEQPREDSILNEENMKDEIKATTQEIKKNLKYEKIEIEKAAEADLIELTQLIEQGDHVIKSDWNSWQVGVESHYSKQNSRFKGNGDKKEKYNEEKILTRSTDLYERYISPSSPKYNNLVKGSSLGIVSTNLREGLPKRYGLVDIREIKGTGVYNQQETSKEKILFRREKLSPTIPSEKIDLNTRRESNTDIKNNNIYEIKITEAKEAAYKSLIPVIEGRGSVADLSDFTDTRWGNMSGNNITERLQKALDDPNIRTIKLPAGQFEISSVSLSLAQDKVILGQGDSTVLMFDKSTNLAPFTAYVNGITRNVRFSDFVLDLGYTPGDIATNAFQFTNADNMQLYHMTIRNVGKSAVLAQGYQKMNTGSSNLLVLESVIDGAGLENSDDGFGILIKDDSKDAVIVGNRITNIVGGMGIGLNSITNISGTPNTALGYSTGAAIIGNFVSMNPSNIAFEGIGLTEGSDDAIIAYNMIEPSYDNGLSVTSSNNLVVKNYTSSSYNHGLALFGENNTVIANEAHNNGIQNIAKNEVLTYGAITLEEGKNNVIANNVSYGGDVDYGVKFNGNNLGNNTFSNNTYTWKTNEFNVNPSATDTVNQSNDLNINPMTSNERKNIGQTAGAINSDAVISGQNKTGIILSDTTPGGISGIRMAEPVVVSGTNLTGIEFDLSGTSSTIINTMNNPPFVYAYLDDDSSASTGISFESKGNQDIAIMTDVYIEGKQNKGIHIKDGKLHIRATNRDVRLRGGSENIGIYAESDDELNIEAGISVISDNSTALLAKNAGDIKSTGPINIKGTSVKGIVADNTKISVIRIGVDGYSSSETGGSIGISAINNGEVNSDYTSGILVDGFDSKGLYVDTGGKIDMGLTTIIATNGATAISAEDGTINFSNSPVIVASSGASAFEAGNSGKINFLSQGRAIIRGGNDPLSSGAAFHYKGTNRSPFNISDVLSWTANTFGGTLGNLILDMNPGSRLFEVSDVTMNLSGSSVSSLLNSLGAQIVGTDYKNLTLHDSHLTINQSVNLDNSTDPYNLLWVSNSSINNENTVIGTKLGQIAIGQENLMTNRNKVTLINNRIINLTGSYSTGMYSKFGVLNNNATGTITVGNQSMGLYGTQDTIFSNTGTISVGNSSAAIYSEGSTTQGVTNVGNINGGTASIGILYKPDISIPAGTVISNTGNIALGDQSIGLYGEDTSTGYILENTGNITVGDKGVGLYGYGANVSGGTIKIGDGGVGVYSQSGNVNLTGGTITTGAGEATGVYTVGNGQTIVNSGTQFNLGDTSVAISNKGLRNTINSTVNSVMLGNNNIYISSNDVAGIVNNSTNLSTSSTSAGGNYGIYSAGTVTNSGNIDFKIGTGNIGIYSIGGGTATNTGIISIGDSDLGRGAIAIGMAAGYKDSDTGNIVNNGRINVDGNSSVGMYVIGAGSTATNTSNIILNGNNTTGIYADDGATVNNSGNISTASGNYSNIVGVYLGQGSTLNNTGTINIDGIDAVGVYLKGGTIANYGNITVNGSSNQVDTVTEAIISLTDKSAGEASIDVPKGAQTATVRINGKEQIPVNITTYAQNPVSVSASSIGLYVNTSDIDYTSSINGLGNLTQQADLIIGTEAAEQTNSKAIVITDSTILDPYNNAIRTSKVSNWNIYSGGLTWLATPILNTNDGTMKSIYMVKVPYTAWAGNDSMSTESKNVYNFLDGLEQRYGTKALGTRENQLFQKLNSIGNNEEILFIQAVDEMMGHQYANTQQRINLTGNILDKEISHLKNDWSNPSKEANKIKIFGTREEYDTNTAGVIDYTSNSYGVAYVHEDETIKLGNSKGWYAGYIQNSFGFKDIGKSKEKQDILKAGIFKSKAFDDNGSLKWTISGEGFIGRNDMKRRYLVVDEIFDAEGIYYTYGLGVKNEISKEFRTSERTSIRPYGSLELEYGRFSKIKEKEGEMRLEVKGSDYYSIKPEVGIEFKYKQPVAVKTNLTSSFGIAYENELGKVNNNKNKARIGYTTSDWFDIIGDKENRRGNFKVDFKLGIENTRFGVTLNAGYDTKGDNFRGGIGLRMIY